MRKMMKTAIAALLLSGTAMKPALAQNCTSSTRCAELGYKKSAADCDGMESLVCPFDKSKYYCVDVAGSLANATPGMILYSDGTVSENVISGKTPVGVVAYVDGSTRLAVALEEISSNIQWSTQSYEYENLSCLADYSSTAEAQTDFRGATNTSCIVNYRSNNSYPAAEYCNNSYKPVSSGTGSSGWYLPAAGELYMMNFSYEAINLGLQKLSKTQLQSAYYWSSSEYAYGNRAWRVNPYYGLIDYDYTYNGNSHVRCVRTF